ncbi:hypothetical protein [Pseudoalteromonas sp. SWYJZ19]|jgi:hypothetical protein|uniref:hypothetical protein n=1 Tax=Pseudoalteromonas sp. SWYJZ19 TaxID=2792068 RepID=UPI0018CE9148|nr:hypothetical protein [Pseudoalteromonas sp. SWYJZ19]MBH0050697.1 hypothetical protein [Pseudoalteromonas sp. SWYJZ19]
MPYADQNLEITNEVANLSAQIPSTERLADHLTPIIINAAPTPADALSDLATHYLTLVHMLSVAHDDIDKREPHYIVLEVNGLVEEALTSVKEQLMLNPDFALTVTNEAERLRELA